MTPRALHLLAAAALALAGCPDPEEPRLADGIFADRLGDPLPTATPEQLAAFERGRAVAERRFTPEDGLGPTFNLTFCAGCHEKPVTGGSASRYRNFLLVGQRLSDGSFAELGANGVLPQFDVHGGRVPTPDGANSLATRNPIPFFGTGLLAAIDEEAILANADPDDADGDGISGRPNWDRGFVGRFGRKAQTVSIEGFIRGPLFNHVGLTSNPLSDARKAALPVPSAAPTPAAVVTRGALSVVRLAQAAAPDEPTVDDDGVPDPELSEQNLFDLVSFSMLLAAPRPDPPTDLTRAGERAFHDVGCAACHVPALRGPRGLIPAYSDLLLHDMGPDLADGVPMGVATGSEFRTQPLWGVGATAPYLHDGRADTLDDAIRWHGGEGAASRDRYLALSADDRLALIAFLESLGGAAQHTAGLLPPDAPLPPPGAFGGPARPLSPDDADRFLRGRDVFDRDAFLAEGLGPVFNGDGCRSCHFDPVIGGAGPNDVNVIRHGHLDPATGAFVEPPFGTIAHRFATRSDARPPFALDANVVEQRQTPAIFGLGLVDRIPDAAILARADPDDLDGDGVRGRAHVLPDGRLGRLGWKAQVPSLAEFARDAATAELGLTVPPQPGLTFGALTDGDDVADPELSRADLDDLVFFMATLAPPPRDRREPAREDAGEAHFAAIGCATCHTPSLPTVDGPEARLYSDLLLHDVAPEGASGVADGLAGPTEHRTPPLWGLRHTAPYLHDGRASTIEAAIRAHAGTATASREAYDALGPEARAELLAFLRSL